MNNSLRKIIFTERNCKVSVRLNYIRSIGIFSMLDVSEEIICSNKQFIGT